MKKSSFYMCLYHYAFITCGGFSLYIGFIVANALTVFVILRYILGCVVLYNKIIMWDTQHKHINPPYNQRVKTSTKKKTTYGL